MGVAFWSKSYVSVNEVSIVVVAQRTAVFLDLLPGEVRPISIN